MQKWVLWVFAPLTIIPVRDSSLETLPHSRLGALSFPFTGPGHVQAWPRPCAQKLQLHEDTLHPEVGVEELECPAQNPNLQRTPLNIWTGTGASSTSWPNRLTPLMLSDMHENKSAHPRLRNLLEDYTSAMVWGAQTFSKRKPKYSVKQTKA